MGENVKRFSNDRNPNGLGYSNGVVEDERGYYVLHSDYEAIARQAEALQRENAEKDARIALLRESLLGFEHACEQLAATRTHEIYTAMIDGGQAQELLELDNARRRARALLGGENAE